MADLTVISKDLSTPAEMGAMMQAYADSMRLMTEQIRLLTETVQRMNDEIGQLTKVTPAQAQRIGSAISDRAASLAAAKGLTGAERQIGNAIRRAIKHQTGYSSIKQLPRRDYQLVIRQIGMWEDYTEIKQIREGMSK